MTAFYEGSVVEINNTYLAGANSNTPQLPKIKLNARQYNSFQQGGIEMCAPDGRVLGRFSSGYLVDENRDYNQLLRSQLHFVINLFLYMNELRMPDKVVRDIEDLIIKSYLLYGADSDINNNY